MTWRFHSFMISFSPSLTSVKSSICCSESREIRLQTESNHFLCLSKQSKKSRKFILTRSFNRAAVNPPWRSSLWASPGPSHPRCPPPSPAAGAARSCRCGSKGGCVRWCTSSAAPDRRPQTPETQTDSPSSSWVWTERVGRLVRKKISRNRNYWLFWNISVRSSGVPAGENVSDGGPLDRTVPAEGEARLVVDVLRVSCIRTIVTVVNGDLDLRSFRMRLPRITRGTLLDTELFYGSVFMWSTLYSPRSWRWSGSGTVWGVWSDCRASCSSACTRDSGGRLWPPSAAACCCCTGTGRNNRGERALISPNSTDRNRVVRRVWPLQRKQLRVSNEWMRFTSAQVSDETHLVEDP